MSDGDRTPANGGTERSVEMAGLTNIHMIAGMGRFSHITLKGIHSPFPHPGPLTPTIIMLDRH